MPLVSQNRRGFLKRRRPGRKRFSRRRRRNRRITQLFLLMFIASGIYTIGFWRPWSSTPGTAATSDLPAIAQTVDAIPPRNSTLRDSLLDDDPATANFSLGVAATNTLSNLNPPQTIEMGTAPQTGSQALQNALSTTPSEPQTSSPRFVQAPDPIPASTTTQSSRSNSVPSGSVQALLVRASDAMNRNNPVEARAIFNRVLLHPAATTMDRELARDQLTNIAQLLTFSPSVIENDPLAERYTIRSGDSLSKIAAQNDVNIDWRFIARVNKIRDPRRIRVGQTIKLVRGPFHAEIYKNEYRLDLWAELPTDAGGGRVFIASFPVGLGEHNSTPAGNWKVRSNSRLINPPWTNPRTGEYFSADNPSNPIGERWIGLQGIDNNTSIISGIGIHGTINPSSIGTQASMGCIRMHTQDVEVLYELLTEAGSTVAIVP